MERWVPAGARSLPRMVRMPPGLTWRLRHRVDGVASIVLS